MNPLLQSILRTLIRTRFWDIYRQPDEKVMEELDATIQRMLQVIGIEGNVAGLSFKDGKLTIEITADRPPWVTEDEWQLMAQRTERLRRDPAASVDLTHT